MRIAVMLKQVPDPALVGISENGRLMRENIPSMMDPFGKMALQHAISLGCGKRIDAVTMGPGQSEEMLRKALEFGVDEAYLISGREFAGADTFATSRVLAAFASWKRYDLILCGMQATDGDTAQVPSELSAMLGHRIYSYASSASLEDMTVTQTYEGEEIVSRLALPAVISFIRPPADAVQIPSMTDFVRASGKEIIRIGLKDLGLCPCEAGAKGSKTRVVSISAAIRKKVETVVIDGSDTENAAEIVLKEAGV